MHAPYMDITLLAPAYGAIKTGHIALAVASVALFSARGVGVQVGATWPLGVAARRTSVVVDTLLLTAGALLWTLLQLRPDRDAWLGAKLVLIVAYIVLGSLALKRARSVTGKRLALVAALACIGCAAWVARAHDALAPLRGWLA